MNEDEENTITFDKERINRCLYELFTTIYNFVNNHPVLIYKGLPIILVLYMLYPLIYILFYYSPWLMTTYVVYSKLPSGTIPLTATTLKTQILEYLKKEEDNNNKD